MPYVAKNSLNYVLNKVGTTVLQSILNNADYIRTYLQNSSPMGWGPLYMTSMRTSTETRMRRKGRTL